MVVVVVSSLSCVWLFATPWTAVHQVPQSFTNSWSCSNSCPQSQWCHPTISSSVIPFFSCLQSFPASGSFPMKSTLRIRWLKYRRFSFSINPSNEYSGLIYFMIDWFDLLAVQRTLKSLLQHHSSKASILRCSAFLIMWRNSSRKNEEAGMMGTGDWFLGLPVMWIYFLPAPVHAFKSTGIPALGQWWCWLLSPRESGRHFHL